MRLTAASLLGLLSFGGPVAVSAQECASPPSLTERDINNDTKASLSALKQLLGGAEIDNKISLQMRNVFIEHPETMQYYVLLVVYHDGCVVIRDSKTLTTEQKLQELEKLRKEVIPPLSLSPAATTSAPLSSKPLGFNPAVHNPIVLVGATVGFEGAPQSLSWAEKYLRPVPFTFTSGNQYWVDVGYATDLAEGKRKLASLKERYPEFDFALYAPFGRNDKWNIVMASWVSRQEAEAVLAEAKRINPTSFIWRACSSMKGNECVLNRKLLLAMHLNRQDK